MKDLSTTSSDLFNKIRSRFSDIKIGDEEGAVTTDPTQARFFDLSYQVAGEELGRVNIKIDDSSLTVIYNEEMLDNHTDDVRQDWYKFLRELRQFARRNLLTFDTRDITKSNLTQRDYAYLAQESGENNMSESKLFGTSKTSYQDIGEAKIIVKHSQPVNYNIPAGRTQHIESIYIESANGERFRYPTRHLNGARAMATHVANGGNPYDSIGGYITGLSEEMSKLRQFKNYTQRAGVMAEALGDLPSKVAERLESLKSEVASLQKQSYYESFRESFEPRESQEVPEEMANQWVDALTIKTFNEELKAVFPYIYKLVAEKSDLTYDDLVAEASDVCEVCNESPCVCDEEVKEHSMFDEFVSKVEELATPEFDLAEDSDILGQVDQLLAQGAKVDSRVMGAMGHIDRVEGNHVTLAKLNKPHSKMKYSWLLTPERLAGIELVKAGPDHYVLKDTDAAWGDKQQSLDLEMPEGAESNASGITQEVVEFIQSMYDSATGTFPRGEEGVKIACEKKFGEQAGQFAHYVVEKLSDQGCSGQQMDEAGNESADDILRQIADTENWDALYDLHSSIGSQDPALNQAANIVDDMYQDIARELGAHADDDFEAIYNEILDRLIADYGTKESVTQPVSSLGEIERIRQLAGTQGI